MQYFKRGKEKYAMSLVKIRILRQKGGGVSPEEALALMKVKKSMPKIPDWVSKWQEADQQFYEESMRIKKR